MSTSHIQSSSVQLLSRVWLFATPWTAASQASHSFTISQSLLNSCSLCQLCYSTILSPVIPFSCLQSFPASVSFQVSQLFASGGQSIGVSASTLVLPVNIQDWFPFRMDWLDFLAVQGTLKSLLQHHSSNTSILRCSAFFTVQLSHPYTTTRKTIALTRRTLVGKTMSLLFNMLSRLVITFLPRSKCLLISRLQSPSAVTLEPPRLKSDTVSTVLWKRRGWQNEMVGWHHWLNGHEFE